MNAPVLIIDKSILAMAMSQGNDRNFIEFAALLSRPIGPPDPITGNIIYGLTSEAWSHWRRRWLFWITQCNDSDSNVPMRANFLNTDLPAIDYLEYLEDIMFVVSPEGQILATKDFHNPSSLVVPWPRHASTVWYHH